MEGSMIINEKKFAAYCSHCNTEIYDILYSDLLDETVEEEVAIQWSYDTKKIKINQIICPVCKRKIKAYPQGIKKKEK